MKFELPPPIPAKRDFPAKVQPPPRNEASPLVKPLQAFSLPPVPPAPSKPAKAKAPTSPPAPESSQKIQPPKNEKVITTAEAVQPPSPPAEVVAAPAHELPPKPPSTSRLASPTMSATHRWAVIVISILVLTIIGVMIYSMKGPAISPTRPVTSSTNTANQDQKAPPVGIVVAPQPTGLATPLAEATPTPKTYRLVNDAPGYIYILDLRQGPGSNYPVVARMPHGIIPGITLGPRRVADGSTIWQEISVQGYTGFVSETYLEAESAEH